MLRLIIFFISVAAIAWGLSWLADRPGQIIINWSGREVEITVFHAVIALLVLLGATILGWSLLRYIMGGPSRVVDLFRRRKQARGLDALSTGIIAVGSGDRELANRYASQARRALPHEPLTELLRAQAASLSGDKLTAHRIYESMLSAPDTEVLGLRGLFVEAKQEGADEAARQFAERAMKINPKLDWPVTALFDAQCKNSEWEGALETLVVAKRNGHVERELANRRRAVLLTAQAQELEDSDMDGALALAQEAHKLAPDLVPAADITGRILASKGHTAKAAKAIASTWKKSPHPDLAVTYAYARPGDSPKDRLKRVKDLTSATPHSVESPIAVAVAAIEALDWPTARHALRPLLDKKLSQRVCALMARIEDGEHGDRGRVREWLARAVTAPRDPAWTADGYVADHWAPVSPETGQIDAFEWKVPVERLDTSGSALTLEDLVPLAVAADSGDGDAAAAVAGPGSAARDVTPDADAEPEAREAKPPEVTPVVAASVAAASVAAADAADVADTQGDSGTQEPQAEIVTAAAMPASANGRDDPVQSETVETVAVAPVETAKPERTPDVYIAPRAPDDPGVIGKAD